MRFSKTEARRIGNKIKVNWDKVNINEFQKGLEVEWEHRKVLGSDVYKVGRVASDHLKEKDDYYTRLKIVESKKKLR